MTRTGHVMRVSKALGQRSQRRSLLFRAKTIPAPVLLGSLAVIASIRNSSTSFEAINVASLSPLRNVFLKNDGTTPA
jgi:hypothetical protein